MENEKKQLSDMDFRYLILSGEGNIDTEHQFCMECTTLEEANMRFDNFKKNEFSQTSLYIYQAIKLREQ